MRPRFLAAACVFASLGALPAHAQQAACGGSSASAAVEKGGTEVLVN